MKDVILIVEDDPQVARLIALVLRRAGRESVIVADGVSAMEKQAATMPKHSR